MSKIVAKLLWNMSETCYHALRNSWAPSSPSPCFVFMDHCCCLLDIIASKLFAISFLEQSWDLICLFEQFLALLVPFWQQIFGACWRSYLLDDFRGLARVLKETANAGWGRVLLEGDCKHHNPTFFCFLIFSFLIIKRRFSARDLTRNDILNSTLPSFMCDLYINVDPMP